MKLKFVSVLIALAVIAMEASRPIYFDISKFNKNTSSSSVFQPMAAVAADAGTSSATYTVYALTLKDEAGSNVNSFMSDDGVYSLAVYSCVASVNKEVISEEYYVGITEIADGKTPALALNVSEIEYSVPSKVTELMKKAGFDTSNLESVKLISSNVFSGTSIKSINLTGVVYIGKSAFSLCPYITEVTVPETVEYLGTGVFASSGLKTLDLDCSLVKVPNSLCSKTKVSQITLKDLSSLREIGKNAFEGTPLTSLPFADAPSLQLIDDSAFKGCTQIKSLTIPDAVIRVNQSAFSGCTALETFVMGKNLTVVDKSAFQDCTALKQITFNSSLRSLGGGVFRGCTSLTEVKGIPETMGDWEEVTEDTGFGFGNYVFAECTKLRSVELPTSLTYIPEGMFASCTSLTSAVFNGNIKGIADEAFLNCKNLQEVAFVGKSITNIGKKAFMGCSSLISLPTNSCETVCDNAFANCTSVTDATLTADVYGSYVFSGCTALKTAKFNGASSKTLPAGMFNGCSKLTSIIDTSEKSFSDVQIVGKEAFKNCISLPSVSFNNVVILEDACFSGCTSLKSICTGDIVAEDYAKDCFKGCTRLAQAVNCYASTVGDNAFMGSGIPELSIKGTVGTTVVFGNNAFASCTKLKKATIEVEKGIEYSIGSGLFKECTALETASFSGTEITESMFEECTSLRKVILPNASDISASAFSGCSLLSEIDSPTFSTVGDSAFLDCVAVTALPIDIDTTFSGDSQFSGCKRLTEMTARTLTDSMFYGCSAIRTVKVGSDVSVIPANCFMNCTSLRSMDLKGITTFEAGSMANTGLEGKLTLAEVATIGNKAFAGCRKLGSLDVTANVIGASAFEGCTSLSSATVCSNEIQRSAFYKCDNLKKVTLQEVAGMELTSVGSSAFADCPLLSEVVIAPNGAEIASKAFGYVSGKAKEDFWVVGNKGSTAESYASNNSFTFVPVSEYDATGRELSKKLLGDVDCNGLISVADAVRMQSWLLGRSVGVYGANMDMNGDSRVDVFDMCLLRRKLLE